MDDADPRQSIDEEKLMVKSVNEDTRDQITISQINSETIRCALTSVDNHESELLASVIEKAKIGEDENFRNDKTVSSINKRIDNKSKEESADMPFEKTYEVIEKVFNSSEGLPGKEERPKERKPVFSLLDPLISVSVIGPLVIGFWRGIWAWMDLHTELFPGWFCFTFGAALHVIFAILKNRFHDIYLNKWIKSSPLARLPYHALRILYTYIFGVACNAHWRGGWIIIDDYLFMHIWITTCSMCLLLACLAILRCVRNLIAPPLIIFIDTPGCVFQFPTRYNAFMKRLYHIADRVADRKITEM